MEKVPSNEVALHRRKIIPCKLVFKIKHKLDKMIRYKTRLIVKGFYQVLGVDYTESFSSVASLSTIVSIALLLLRALHMEDQKWTCKMFDVEASFLNAELETPMILEWSESMIELGFFTEEEEEIKCIKLVRSMYHNVDAAFLMAESICKTKHK